MSFYIFFKKFNFLLKIHVLAYGFNKNYQFATKTDRNAVFLGRDLFPTGYT
jgi:hypothetical protein